MLPPEGQALLTAFKAARTELAKAQGVPPYVIFHDKSLLDMALIKPDNMQRMALVHGIGEQKMEKCGQTFLQVVAKFL